MNKIDKLINELCPKGVEFKELGEVCEIKNWYSFKSWKYSKNGIRIIRISDVQKGKISDKDIKYYPFEEENNIKNYLLKENDLVMSLTWNVGRVAMISKDILPAWLNQRVACIRSDENKILTRFLFHFFDQDSFENEAMSNATWWWQKNMSTRWLSKFKIPLPPLDIQKEIVKILDNFTKLEAELEAELEARMKQYEYYRDKLLSFEDEEVEWKELGEVALYSKNRIFALELDKNTYIWVDNLLQNKQGKTFSKCVPISWNLTEYKIGDILIWNIRPYLKKIWYATNNWWTNWDVLVIRIKKEFNNNIKSRFLYHLLASDNFFYYNMKNAKWAKMPRWDKIAILKYKVPIPPIEKQKEIVSILDKFDALVNDINKGLPAEIEARRKQYEYYRGKLLEFEEREE